jgi:uncharacterized protein
MFKIKEISKPKLKNVIMIEGLPGLGSVGKIAVDFMIENLDAKKFMEISSDGYSNSVFVNEENLIDLPKVELFYKNLRGNDLIFVSGDVQPIDEKTCYDFCNVLLEILHKYKGKEVVTLGGIGLPKIIKTPKVYCTGTDQKIVKRYNHKKLNSKIFGTVGPIVGVTGLLAGLAGERGMNSIIILAQTFSHPAYMGISGAKEILDILNDHFKLNMKISELGKEIRDIEKEIQSKRPTVGKKAPVAGENVVEGKVTYIG